MKNVLINISGITKSGKTSFGRVLESHLTTGAHSAGFAETSTILEKLCEVIHNSVPEYSIGPHFKFERFKLGMTPNRTRGREVAIDFADAVLRKHYGEAVMVESGVQATYDKARKGLSFTQWLNNHVAIIDSSFAPEWESYLANCQADDWDKIINLRLDPKTKTECLLRADSGRGPQANTHVCENYTYQYLIEDLQNQDVRPMALKQFTDWFNTEIGIQLWS